MRTDEKGKISKIIFCKSNTAEIANPKRNRPPQITLSFRYAQGFLYFAATVVFALVTNAILPQTTNSYTTGQPTNRPINFEQIEIGTLEVQITQIGEGIIKRSF